jgi:hypothetical protein
MSSTEKWSNMVNSIGTLWSGIVTTDRFTEAIKNDGGSSRVRA